MRPTLLFLTLLLISGACQKQSFNIPDYASELIGEYDWYYSSQSISDSYSQDTHTDRYGIRIDEKSRFYVFKNGKRLYNGRIKDIQRDQNAPSIWNIYVYGDDIGGLYLFQNGILTTDISPFTNYTNQWKQK